MPGGPVTVRLTRSVVALAAVAGLSALLIAPTTAPAAPWFGRITGTTGPDRLVGTPGPERIHGLAGDDVLIGGGSLDNLQGGDGDDLLIGGAAIDLLTGGGGNDELRGGAGSDSLAGGPGRDTLRGGPGDDYVSSRGDGAADIVSCGPGDDQVQAGARDVVAADCERLERTLPLGTAPTPVTIEFLGWVSSDARFAPLPAAVPAGAVPSGGTLTACAASDRYLYAFIRANGLVARTGVRAVLTFPSQPDAVDLDAFRTVENGLIGFYGPFRTDRLRPDDPAPNGDYSLQLSLEAGGVYTPAMATSVRRSCA